MSPAVEWSVQSQQKQWAKFIKNKMFYSESEPDFSDFAINSLSNFDLLFLNLNLNLMTLNLILVQCL